MTKNDSKTPLAGNCWTSNPEARDPLYRIFLIPVFLFGLTFISISQGNVIPLSSKQEYLIERMSIKYGVPSGFHRAAKPYFRKDIVDLIFYWDSLQVLSPADDKDIQYLFDENNEWLLNEGQIVRSDSGSGLDSMGYRFSKRPVLKHFYRTPAHFLEVNKKDFYLRLNPVLNVQTGRETGAGDWVLANQRGADLRVGLDQKIYAQSTILENQLSLPAFFRNKVEKNKALPGAGFYKYFSDKLYKPQGYDFFISNAHLGFQVSKHFHIQFGHGSHFLGDGLRSLFLSDYAQEYFFLKFQARVWKLHYQSLFAELSASTPTASPVGNVLLPKKYSATHTLQTQLSSRWSLGLFETVIFNRNNHFEFQYLNPVIIYRSVEGSIGSPDNVMLGINSRYDLGRKVSVYGQLLIDEFVRKEVFNSGKGWWGNKFGGQLGLKYIDAFGIPKMDLQAEYNSVRPYTYTHFDSTANYTHQRTPLAHPLGANFKEFILNMRYQPAPRWHVHAYLMAYRWGDDPVPSVNYGGDLQKPYTTRLSDYGNKTTQGKLRNIRHLGFNLSYEMFHNYFLDLNGYYRKDMEDQTDITKFIGAGIRVNFWRKDLNLL